MKNTLPKNWNSMTGEERLRWLGESPILSEGDIYIERDTGENVELDEFHIVDEKTILIRLKWMKYNYDMNYEVEEFLKLLSDGLFEKTYSVPTSEWTRYLG